MLRAAATRTAVFRAFSSSAAARHALVASPPALAGGDLQAITNALTTAAANGPVDLISQQATEGDLMQWCTGPVGLQEDVARGYVATLQNEGFDSPAALAMASLDELARLRIRTGHARVMLARASELKPKTASTTAGGIRPPRLFDYATVTSNVAVTDAVEAIEAAFAKLADGKVDVPFPMHIGIDETSEAGPGDCHIKGGYISGTKTFTVKLACVSFYKNLEKGLPPGGGIFVVMDAVTGAPLAIMQENRFLTDLRTGAAGAVAVKHLTAPNHTAVGFLGCGAIAKVMARGTAAVKPGFKGIAFAHMGAEEFADDMSKELGVEFTVVKTAQELCQKSDVLFTQTTGSSVVLEKKWLRPHATIIASGSDQPTKQELPVDLIAGSKYVCDLVKQVSKVGELRSALKAGAMKESDVYAELGQIVNGSKPGRVGNETIVCDLTGTGAQDAAIGQVAWDKLSKL